jgi:hypothetical protein
MLASDDWVWSSLGLLNTVIYTREQSTKTAVLRWGKRRGVGWESWLLLDGVVKEQEFGTPDGPEADLLASLAAFADDGAKGELRPAAAEFSGLMASALTRGGALPRDMQDELRNMATVYLGICKKWVAEREHYDALGELITLNSALSRLTTELLTGVGPIREHQCGLVAHSLLGVGVPMIALRSLRHFLQSRLDGAAIAERFAALDEFKTGFPHLSDDETLPKKDYLAEATPKLDSTDATVPLIAYYSGREGYRSTETSISAPLATIACCNSLKWSLHTLTHEMLHVLVRDIQLDLTPLETEEGQQHLFNLLEDWTKNGASKAPNLLDEIRQTMLLSYVRIAQSSLNQKDGMTFSSPEALGQLLGAWRHEVDEVLVHVLDFLYFFENAPEYVRSIWSSWGVIPAVATRVRGYLVRTICAVLSANLGRLNRKKQVDDVGYSMRIVEKVLSKMGTAGGPYVQVALRELDDNWDDIAAEVEDRWFLVMLARHFMWTSDVGDDFSREPAHDSSTATGGKLYPHKPSDLDFPPIGNPLKFVATFSQRHKPSEVESAWLLYVLAFGVDHGGARRA